MLGGSYLYARFKQLTGVTMKTFTRYANAFAAWDYCSNLDLPEQCLRHEDLIRTDLDKSLPGGSGFDNGSAFNFHESRVDRLIFDTAYHHMNENGYYIGWTYHQVIVTPSLQFG